jgi:hypothetical protein
MVGSLVLARLLHHLLQVFEHAQQLAQMLFWDRGCHSIGLNPLDRGL